MPVLPVPVLPVPVLPVPVLPVPVLPVPETCAFSLTGDAFHWMIETWTAWTASRTASRDRFADRLDRFADRLDRFTGLLWRGILPYLKLKKKEAGPVIILHFGNSVIASS